MTEEYREKEPEAEEKIGEDTIHLSADEAEEIHSRCYERAEPGFRRTKRWLLWSWLSSYRQKKMRGAVA